MPLSAFHKQDTLVLVLLQPTVARQTAARRPAAARGLYEELRQDEYGADRICPARAS
jgi:hypothetical protein